MAKKRTNPAPKRRTSKKSKRQASEPQLFKIIVSLVLLAALVVLSAVLVRLFIPAKVGHYQTASERNGQDSQPAGTGSGTARHMPVPSIDKPDTPTYEIFPQKPTPPPEPPNKLLPIPGSNTPVVAIVVDDIGYDRQVARELLELDVPITFSILPYGPFNDEILSEAHAKGTEIMLHLPMEPDEFPAVNPGPGALLAAMTPDELIAQLNEDLDRVPDIVGVNNHMGSRLSTSPEHMRQIFSILKKRELFYIDSRTTAETVARSSAELLQLPFAERDIFIDHRDDPKFIRHQLNQLIKRARRQGYAVGIAHPHPTTVAQLKAFLPRLTSEVTLVPASVLVRSVMLAEAGPIQTARKGRH